MKPHKSAALGLLSLLLLAFPAWAAKESPAASCPDTGGAVTTPAPVAPAEVLESLALLKTADGKPAIELSSTLVETIHHVFDTNKTKTKMEQFYRLLYAIAMELPAAAQPTIELDTKTTRELLLRSKVFTDPAIPNEIKSVKVDRSQKKEPRYTVTFGSEQTRVPLNRGEGFFLFRDGKCQHAQQLIFDQTFSFALTKNDKGNLITKDFKGVDLFGDFGNRGVFDVDLQYVELRSVEFFHGTQLGKVRAYVSREEFKKNKHNPILRVITKFVGDTSVQPIDW